MSYRKLYQIAMSIDKHYPASEEIANSFFWRLLVKKPSYFLAAIFIILGIKPNTVTYLSLYLSIIAFLVFVFFPSEYFLLAAILLNLWNVLDAVDGNIARYTGKTSLFGHFLDTVACYFTIALSFLAIGFAADHSNNRFDIFPDLNYLLMGALASISNILMRLIYQNKKNCFSSLPKLEVKRDDIPFVRKVDIELGISGFFMVAVVLSSIFSTFNIMVLFYSFYYISALVIFSFKELRE